MSTRHEKQGRLVAAAVQEAWLGSPVPAAVYRWELSV